MGETRFSKIQQTGQQLYDSLNQQTGGRASIPVEAAIKFSQANAPETAASLAFYSVFSLFPLLGILVGIISYVVPINNVRTLLVDVLSSLLPVSFNLISTNIQRFLDQRGAISVLGTIGLLWSASNVFTIVVNHVNLAWEQSRVRSFFQTRLIAVAMIIVIVILFTLLWLATTFVVFLNQQGIYLLGTQKLANSPVWYVIRQVESPVLTFIIFFVIYRWLPNTRVRFSEAAWGAFVVMVVWQITAFGYNLYLGSGLARYDLLYGSLAALAVLMLWFYLNSVILLFGAYLCASIARWRARPAETAGRFE